MTRVYFVRHCETDNTNPDDRLRPLTAKGLADRALVTDFLKDKGICAVLSSPYKRAVDTVADFAERYGLNDIELVEDFRERACKWLKTEREFTAFKERQWADFSYGPPDGECISDVQNRNIAALNGVLERYEGRTIAIGTHGMSLSAIINYYDPSYVYEDFKAMSHIMPWVVRMDFTGKDCLGMVKTDLFNPVAELDISKVRVQTAPLGAYKAYRYVVVFCKFGDKWLYCRAKTRDTYETAGGRIEEGETPLAAAKRELYEETGAVRFDIVPAFDYMVHWGSEYSNGQVFLADIHELAEIPEYEMAEVVLMDKTPERMRFPFILPLLFERMEQWIVEKN